MHVLKKLSLYSVGGIVWLSEPCDIYPGKTSAHTHKHIMYTHSNTHSLMPEVQSGGNSFLTCHRQPATCHAAPHPPNRQTNKNTHTHRRTYPHTHRWPRTGVSRLHISRNPSSRSAAPTSQLSSPNTLHSISAPCEWFIDHTAFHQRNVLFLFRQLDRKCTLFDAQARK